MIEGIDRFERRASVKTWPFRIMINIARSRGVSENRSIPFATTTTIDDEPSVDPHRFRPFPPRARGQWKRPPQPGDDPEQRARDAETLALIDTAVDRLPPDQRIVVMMRDLLGWTAPEVCEALDLTDANQRVLLHRANSKVRGARERHYDDDGRR